MKENARSEYKFWVWTKTPNPIINEIVHNDCKTICGLERFKDLTCLLSGSYDYVIVVGFWIGGKDRV
ncbi:hypothetical protein VNO80_10386 [Phaseolus coccineus]|uniref:Uncharacterized protein n=1 Tax=Phaseolus coccineus TaxID=3886 RepID=A0AAN9RDD9_PHACN